jgi:hypothetical protein
LPGADKIGLFGNVGNLLGGGIGNLFGPGAEGQRNILGDILRGGLTGGGPGALLGGLGGFDSDLGRLGLNFLAQRQQDKRIRDQQRQFAEMFGNMFGGGQGGMPGMGDMPGMGGMPGMGQGTEFNPFSMYGATTPGQSINIDPQMSNPPAYMYYPSEVEKLYAQSRGVPFSPLVAPPQEALFDIQARRIPGQLYAADGTGEQGVDVSKFPERDKLITGPGGEKGDEIPAMLSDGEFVTNAAAVRGIGLMMGADPNDMYEQRMMGAKQLYDQQKMSEGLGSMV